MSHLAQYVQLILQGQTDSENRIIKTVSQQMIEQESDTDVLMCKDLYYFSDGTIIEKNLEQDQLAVEVEACLESWIQYKVIQQPDSEKISPLKIEFNSHCRESHWTNYFK